MTRAVVLFGHGSRDPAWRQPIEAVAERLRSAEPGLPVRCAYLELSEPDLPQTAAELAELGTTQLRIVPMFLGVGRHAREDLPALVEALRARHPQIAFELQPAVGEDPRLLDLLARIARG
ncbi:cobalamin biosynthesis protein CbiX [Xylophilus rhododendri]|uniref:Cobalamin biosynthesis protein CbiX n=1 Tax=Xylophilus rhododendri TaxID=2697032 RepID=A0A857IYD3_9BURK|nr:CbiX/SirB N-terminal domain-containing protein [Xylophilus rhododendri]QHI96560.1 cobalamin biosynthesis protein CbiX [Xylophilus rhododendri]